jgi:Fe-S oxidoreductase
MATYKAEFLSHYYDGPFWKAPRRPLNAYAFGLIDRWSRLASHAPGVANFLSNTGVAKAIAGIPMQRKVPGFASTCFTREFRRTNGQINSHKEESNAINAKTSRAMKVILWPDTFNNYFHPEVAAAAAGALAAAGCEVSIPRTTLCCGRPLYEFGMLDRARSYLQEVMDVLADDIRAGTPIVGLEPACVSVFREELPNLFAHDEQAKRLSRQVLLLSEFLEHKAPAFPFRKLGAKAVVHGHCHQQAVLKMDAERAVLARLGLDYEVLDSGCCGMAGSFGFEKEKYEVSLKCAQRVLIPAVQSAAPETLILTNGFSCRAQIEELSGRSPLHLAQLLQRCL